MQVVLSYVCLLLLIIISVKFILGLVVYGSGSFLSIGNIIEYAAISLSRAKQKQYPAVDVTGDGSKVRCCKEQCCIGTWNVRSINQGKLEVVKQEMARVNINILGISELKWIGMGEFNSDDHYIYYCGQESLRRKRVAIRVNKKVLSAVLGCSLKNDRMISVHFQGKPFTITVTQVYAPTNNVEEAEAKQFYEDLQDLLELTPKKDVLFIIQYCIGFAIYQNESATGMKTNIFWCCVHC